MKKKFTYLLALLGTFCWSHGWSQVGGYTFAASSGTYVPLTGGTDVDDIETDSDLSADLPIGFTFNFDGVDYTTFKASSNGFISFGTPSNSLTLNDLDGVAAASRPLIAPLWDDHDAVASSKASYELSGTVGSQVLTFEWLNWEWNYNASNPVISFQVKLYEGTNVVEFVYRGESGSVNSGSASIGLTGATSFLSLDGTGASPSASSSAETSSLNTKPADGQIYSFTPPTCVAPSGLNVMNLTGTSADFAWTQSGTASEWEVVSGITGFTPAATGVTTTSNPLTSGTLTPNTDYEFYVRTVCAVGDTSNWAGPYAFTTPCAAYTPAYLEEFASYIPSCWSEAKGRLGASSTLTGTTSAWTSDGFLNSGTTGSARVELYSSTANDWLISPSIDLGTGIDYQVEFDVAMTYYSSSAASTFDADDTLALVISTDNGATWELANALRVWEMGDAPSATGEHFIANLSAYSGLVKFGFYAASSAWTADNNLYIDNFEVKLTPACPEPSAGIASSVFATTADLTWTENGSATTWNVEYGASPFTPTGTATLSGLTDGGNGTPVTLTGLTASTTYEYYIQSDCGGGDVSDWAGPYSFSTQCNPLSGFPYVEDFETGATAWSIDGTNSSWEIGTPSATVISAAANGTGAAVTNLTGNYNANEVSYLITPCFDFTLVSYPVISFNHILRTESGYDGAYVEYTLDEVTWTKVGVSPAWDTNPYNNTTYQWWQGTMTTWTATSIAMPSLAGEGLVKFRFVLDADVSSQYEGFGVDDFMIEDVPCPNPMDLITTYADNDSVVITWTAGNVETNWNVEVGENGFAPGTGAHVYAGSTIIETDSIGGLDQITDYQVYIQADCGGGDMSDWVGPIDFTTLPNCNAPSNLIAQVLAPDSVELTWIPGSGGETEWTIAYGENPYSPGDAGGVIVSSTTGAIDSIGNLTQNTTYDFYVLGNCSLTDSSLWVGPETVTTGLFCNNVSGLGATTVIDTAFLSWTAGSNAETSWNVEYGPAGFTLGEGNLYTTSNNNSDTLLGLLGSASYDFYVQAACASGDTSLFVGPFSFDMPLTNDVACDAITLPVDGVNRFFTNAGASVTADETANLNVPFSSSSDGIDGWYWDNDITRSVWFKFIAPASGNVEVNSNANNYGGQSAAFEITDCNDMTTATFIAGNDDDASGVSIFAPNFTVCGLIPGNEYYIVYDEEDFLGVTGPGQIAMKLTEVSVSAGTDATMDVCTIDSLDLYSVITDTDSTGVWSFGLNPTAIVNGDIFVASTVPTGIHEVIYSVAEGCAVDTAIATLNVVAAGQSGTAVSPFELCNAGDVFLPDGLTGVVESGGTWTDDSNTGLLGGTNNNVFNANGINAGAYPFTYTVSNGVCPDASTTISVVINNCTSVEENSIEFSIYPNPNDGVFNLTSSVSEVIVVTVMDVQGKVVYNNKLNISGGTPEVISLDNVETGMYILKVASESNVSTQSFIVK